MEITDHDLLIRVDEKLEQLLKNNAEKTTDFELRIRRLELWGALGLGGAYMITLLFKYIIK